jgi:hypothetical protein
MKQTKGLKVLEYEAPSKMILLKRMILYNIKVVLKFFVLDAEAGLL